MTCTPRNVSLKDSSINVRVRLSNTLVRPTVIPFSDDCFLNVLVVPLSLGSTLPAEGAEPFCPKVFIDKKKRRKRVAFLRIVLSTNKNEKCCADPLSYL